MKENQDQDQGARQNCSNSHTLRLVVTLKKDGVYAIVACYKQIDLLYTIHDMYL